jgi:hypothetical protein
MYAHFIGVANPLGLAGLPSPADAKSAFRKVRTGKNTRQNKYLEAAI